MLRTQQPLQEPLLLTIIRLLRWDKPAGRLILMIPALWAVFLAGNGTPPAPLVTVIVLGSLATSAAGCVVNDLWDRDIDPQVERTRTRPLASKALSLQIGLAVALVAFICSGILALYLNPFTFWLCLAALPFIILYPLAKRVFPIPQLVLSLAWGFAVLISWSAITDDIQPATWFLWAATVLWTLGFDTVYALSDREDDLKIGINSSAIFFGEYTPEAIALFFAGTVGALATLGGILHLQFPFWITLLISLILWTWQYTLLRQPNLPKPMYGKIFGQNVWIGFILLVGMILGILF